MKPSSSSRGIPGRVFLRCSSKRSLRLQSASSVTIRSCPSTTSIRSSDSRNGCRTPLMRLRAFSSRAARSSSSKDRKSTRLNSSHRCISYAVFCLKKKIRQEKVRLRLKSEELDDLLHPSHDRVYDTGVGL